MAATGRALRWIGATLLWLLVVLCLALTIVPHFLDARYYRGPVSDHFDGEHFFNPDGDDGLPVANTGTMLRYITTSDDRPAWPRRVAVTPAKPPARVAGERMLVTWIGHSSVLVQTNGLNILTDPVWSGSAGPLGFGPTRVAEPGVRFEDLPHIDLVLVSHDHYDHMDLATLKRLWDRDRPTIVTSLGNDSVIGQAGVPATARDWGGRVGSGRESTSSSIAATIGTAAGSRTATGRCGRVSSSSCRAAAICSSRAIPGQATCNGRTKRASYGPIRLALIPIGAFRFTAGQMAAGSHIGPVDAVEVYRRLGAARAIGVHWGTFRLHTKRGIRHPGCSPPPGSAPG